MSGNQVHPDDGTAMPSGTAGEGPATNVTLTQPGLGSAATEVHDGTAKTGGVGAPTEDHGTVDGREPVPNAEG